MSFFMICQKCFLYVRVRQRFRYLDTKRSANEVVITSSLRGEMLILPSGNPFQPKINQCPALWSRGEQLKHTAMSVFISAN